MTFSQLKKTLIAILLFGISALFLLLLFASCASRKVNRSETKETVTATTTATDTTSKVTDTKTTIVSVTDTDELELTPIDTTKPIIVTDSKGNSKSYFNSIVRTKKTKANTNIDIVEKVAENGKKEVKSDYKADKVTNNKQTERETVFNWWWLIILIVGVVIWQRKRLFY